MAASHHNNHSINVTMTDNTLAKDLQRLPRELQNDIFKEANVFTSRFNNRTEPYGRKRAPRADVPPSNGSSPFMKLPTEVRILILGRLLPSKNKVFEPYSEAKKMPKVFAILTLNKTIFEELTTILYESRTFGIHVYEGIKDGGIEFLNSGRQPLQHQECYQHLFFPRFQMNDDYGVSRLRKVEITIHSMSSIGKDTRHLCMHTHFVLEALCKLLVQANKGDSVKRLTSLVIRFAETSVTETLEGRTAIMRREHPYWDPDAGFPRSTSIYGLSNIEVILQPFFRLYKAHNVSIELPARMKNYQPIQDFKARLINHMQSSGNCYMANDDLDHKFEAARIALEDWTYSVVHGKMPEMEREVWQSYDKDTADFDLRSDDSSESQVTSMKRKMSDMTLNGLGDNNNIRDDADTYETLSKSAKRALKKKKAWTSSALLEESQEDLYYRQVEQPLQHHGRTSSAVVRQGTRWREFLGHGEDDSTWSRPTATTSSSETNARSATTSNEAAAYSTFTASFDAGHNDDNDSANMGGGFVNHSTLPTAQSFVNQIPAQAQPANFHVESHAPWQQTGFGEPTTAGGSSLSSRPLTVFHKYGARTLARPLTLTEGSVAEDMARRLVDSDYDPNSLIDLDRLPGNFWERVESKAQEMDGVQTDSHNGNVGTSAMHATTAPISAPMTSSDTLAANASGILRGDDFDDAAAMLFSQDSDDDMVEWEIEDRLVRLTSMDAPNTTLQDRLVYE